MIDINNIVKNEKSISYNSTDILSQYHVRRRNGINVPILRRRSI
jgi:hypothetical protein